MMIYGVEWESPRFLEWESLIAPFPDLCLLVPFYGISDFCFFFALDSDCAFCSCSNPMSLELLV